MTWQEQLDLHKRVRLSRRTSKVPVKKVRAKKAKVVTAAQREVKKDVNKIKELLRLLGEDV